MTNRIWNENIDAIICVGRSLADLGVHSYALSQTESLIALTQFKEKSISVLGGDVYILIHNAVEETYDSWHCDQDKSESDEEFLKRSIATSQDYIRAYRNPDALFALVPKT